MLALRSVAFNVLFSPNPLLPIVAAPPPFFLPRRAFMTLAKSWGRTSNALLAVAGIRVEMRGLEEIPPGALVDPSQHQSVWETFALSPLFDEAAFIYKRELIWIPVFGWYLWKSDQVPVDRKARAGAMAGMMESARQELGRGRQIALF